MRRPCREPVAERAELGLLEEQNAVGAIAHVDELDEPGVTFCVVP
jgi:hypothetical protein